MMSSLQATATTQNDIPTPFDILGNTQITRSPNQVKIKRSSQYSSKTFSDDESDSSDLELGEKTPLGCVAPREEVESSSSSEQIREIDPSLAEQVEKLYQMMQLDKIMGSRPQEVIAEPKKIVDESSSSDSDMEHPIDYKPEFQCIEWDDESSDDDFIEEVIHLKPKPNPKPSKTITKKQSAKKQRAASAYSKFRTQLAKLKQTSYLPGRFHNLDSVNYFVATLQKTAKTCSICKHKSNPVRHMQGVTWWGEERDSFRMIDEVTVDVCSTCYNFWAGPYNIEHSTSGFLESDIDASGNYYWLRRPQVKDFFGIPKPQCVYVQVQ